MLCSVFTLLFWIPAFAGMTEGDLASAAAPPNIVLVLVDDLGWADVGCYGSDFYETPNIDRLAAEGMRFTQGYAACAVCSPTRAAVMTGRYPARLGVTDWIRPRFQEGGAIPADKQPPSGYVEDEHKALLAPENALWLDLDEVTLAEALEGAGYVTCHVGKWHLGADDWYPDRQGFDFNVGGCDYGQPPHYFDPYENKQRGIPTLTPRKKGEYLTDREADEAANFIRTHAGRPFFLYMAHYAVHRPTQAKPAGIAKYREKATPHQGKPAYGAMVESVDDALGVIRSALAEAGVAERTVLIFTSDNGGLALDTDNAPLRAGKGYPYEGGLRVPFIVYWPGITTAGATSGTPACSIDLFPTFCAAAGVALPPDRAIDGMDLRPELEGVGVLPRDSLFWHFPHYRHRDVTPYSIVRHGGWKLIKYYEGPSYELFHLGDDPGETRNLAEARPGRVAELEQRLAAWLEETQAKMPKVNPNHRGL